MTPRLSEAMLQAQEDYFEKQPDVSPLEAEIFFGGFIAAIAEVAPLVEMLAEIEAVAIKGHDRQEDPIGYAYIHRLAADALSQWRVE